MTFLDLLATLLGVFGYFTFAGALALRLEFDGFSTGLATFWALLWPLAIPFFTGLHAAGYFLGPPDEGAMV